MKREAATALVEKLYGALASWDVDAVRSMLDEDFVGTTTAKLPLGLGGTYTGREQMISEFWLKLGKNFSARANPHSFSFDGETLTVRGQYVGEGRHGGAPLDAAFVHTLTFAGDRIVSLDQVTDSVAWSTALGERDDVVPPDDTQPVTYEFADGLATVTLNRPSARNALDQTTADAVLAVALRLTAQRGLRAVLIAAAGPAFTVGGDIAVFAGSEPEELSATLIRMVTPYHRALGLLDSLDVPIVCAVQGAAAGGGLGLLHVSDIVLAADDSKFAAGFAGIGFTGDGGSTWFMPRLIGPKRAAEFYLEQRVLTAQEAEDWGLVTRVVPAAVLLEHAQQSATALAAGPTLALGRVRRLLRQSWNVPFVSQLGAEGEGIALSASTADAANAVASFIARKRPTFTGK